MQLVISAEAVEAQPATAGPASTAIPGPPLTAPESKSAKLAYPAFSRISDAIWLRIFNEVVTPFGALEIENADAIITFARRFRPTDIYKIPQSTIHDKFAINLVCRSWYRLFKPLFYECIELPTAYGAQKLADTLQDLRSSHANTDEALPTFTTKRIDLTLDLEFQDDINSRWVNRQVLDSLRDIVAACPNLTCFSCVVPEMLDDSNKLIGVLTDILTALPGYLKRLELDLPIPAMSLLSNIGGQHGLHSFSSLKVLWLSMPDYDPKWNRDMYAGPMTHVRTLILQYKDPISNHPSSQLDALANGRWPWLRTVAILPPITGTPTEVQEEAMPKDGSPRPSMVISDMKQMISFSFVKEPDGVLIGQNAWRQLDTVYFSYHSELCSQEPKPTWELVGTSDATTFFLSFTPKGGEHNPRPEVLDENLYSIAAKAWLPNLKKVRLCLPLVYEEEEPLLSGRELYVWKPRLARLSEAGITIEVASSEEPWAASSWRQVSAEEAYDILKEAKMYPLPGYTLNTEHGEQAGFVVEYDSDGEPIIVV